MEELPMKTLRKKLIVVVPHYTIVFIPYHSRDLTGLLP